MIFSVPCPYLKLYG